MSSVVRLRVVAPELKYTRYLLCCREEDKEADEAPDQGLEIFWIDRLEQIEPEDAENMVKQNDH